MQIAKRNICNKIYVTGRRKFGNSYLNHHTIRCDKNKNEDVDKMILDIQRS